MATRYKGDGVIKDTLSIAAEAIDSSLERLLMRGLMGSLPSVMAKVAAILEDGMAGLDEADRRVVVAAVVTTRLMRAGAETIRLEGLFSGD